MLHGRVTIDTATPQIAKMLFAPPGVQLPSDMKLKTQPDTLGELSFKFLENLKTRFGEQSRQSNDVHETLSAFKRGEASKRDVHKTILDTLDGHDDLRQELMDILTHPEARWAPGDFELPTEQQMQPFLEPSPRFLQPTHQPQMRLPAIPSSWFPLPQVEHTVSSGVFSGYNIHRNTGSSPGLPVLAPFQLPDSPTHFRPDDSGNTTYTHVDDNLPIPPPIRTAFRNPWEESSYNDTWTNDGLSFPLDNTYIDEQYQGYGSPALAYNDNFQPQVLRPQDTEPILRPSPLQQESPRLLYSPQQNYDAPPPPTDHQYHHSVRDQQHPVDNNAPPTPVFESPPDLQKVEHPEEHAVETKEDTAMDRGHSLGGPCIHSLCGKGFATPSKVKKHHWGKKNDDIATKTGCWAKHKKPNVAWDDHPSCKGRRSTAGTTKSAPTSSRQTKPEAVVPDPNIRTALDSPLQSRILDFPTLDDLPHTVAKILSAGTATMSSPQEMEPRYHDHRLPSRSSFDSLLTAVNVVSQIDAPTPQGRTDSIVMQLDAQVAAAERHGQLAPLVPFRPLSNSFDPRFVRPVEPIVLDMTAPSMGGSSPQSASAPRSKVERTEHLLALPSDVEESYAATGLSQPLKSVQTHSSGPARKKRKV